MKIKLNEKYGLMTYRKQASFARNDSIQINTGKKKVKKISRKTIRNG